MIISISNASQETWLFSAIFFVILACFIRRREVKEWLPASLTVELKGLSILLIVLSHVGYFLVSDTNFLQPFSNLAGIGVNLFLFLSGYGLTVSQLSKDLNIGGFYKRRLWKLFIPFWLLLVVILPLDIFILKINYSWDFIVKAILGIFDHADLYQDFNSPLWYFTFIIGYYLLFPIFFSKKRPWLTALILIAAGYLLVYINPSALYNVIYLYRVHILAFPLGVLAAWAFTKLPSPVILETWSRGWKSILYYSAIICAALLFVFVNKNSGVGASYHVEQLMSIIAVFLMLIIAILARLEFKIFYLIGVYSYELYLWHWPLMYRYDIFYRFVPGWLATLLYLFFFIGFGWLMSKIAEMISDLIANPKPKEPVK